MSEQETYTGKLIPVDLGGRTLDEKIQEILGTTELRRGFHDWVEVLTFDCYKEYFFDPNAGILYYVEKEEMHDDYIHMTDNQDGTYSFVTSFYNGGTNLDEVLASELNRIS